MKVVACQRVEPSYRFVEEQQLRVAGKRDRERYLGVLAAGQLAHPAVEGDGKLVEPSRAEPSEGVGLVPARAEVADQTQGVRYGQIRIQRGVLRDEADPVQRLHRARPQLVENRDLTDRRHRESNRQVQQCGLAGTLGPDQRDDPARRDRQRAPLQRPGATVTLAESMSPIALTRRSPPPAGPVRAVRC
jgi:hypothetical protein